MGGSPEVGSSRKVIPLLNKFLMENGVLILCSLQLLSKGKPSDADISFHGGKTEVHS